jgi:hypothetical protein
VLPLQDPDTPVSYDVLWDEMVPKDEDLGSGTDVFDLDTATADTDPEFEPGEPDISKILREDTVMAEIWKRRQLISFPKSPVGFQAGTPDTYYPIDAFKSSISKPIRIDYPSVILFGVSSPNLSDINATLESSLSESSLMQMKYIDTVLERALMAALGLIEAGAETPWIEALSVLEEILEPDLFQTTSSAWSTNTWTCFSTVTFDVSVPGEFGKVALTSG